MLICAATGNAGKLKEIRRILQAQGHTVKSQKELGVALEPEETGATFGENALIKAKAICEACGLPTLADDSGLAVEALDGAPGVYSARYCGVHGDDEGNNDKLLDALAGVPEAQRGAKFVSAVCFYLPGGRHVTFYGECPGRVTFARRGENGFGYDPLFVPLLVGLADGGTRENAEGRTYAELAAWEKDAISHRGAAMRLLDEHLPAFLARAADAQSGVLASSVGATIVQIDESLGFERDEKFDGDKLTRRLR